MALTPDQEISEILNRAFQRIKNENPRFSLRALSAKLQLTPSYVSKVMRGLKPLTPALITNLKKGLSLDNIEVQGLQKLILNSIEERLLSEKTGVKSLTGEVSKSVHYKSLSKKDFILLEQWFYIPILNLTTLKTFQKDPQWIAQALQIDVRDAKAAVKTLLRLGYLVEQGETLVQGEVKARFPTDKSHQSIRTHHIGMMKKAEQELRLRTEQDDFSQRLINGISFAGDSTRLQQAQAILNKALYEAAELMANGQPDQVYQLNLQLFKVTK